MGFIPLPLGVLATRIISQAVEIPNWGGVLILIIAFMCLVSFRVLSNIITLGKACDLIDGHQKQRAATSAAAASSTGFLSRFFRNSKSIFISFFHYLAHAGAAACTSPRASRPEKRTSISEDTESNDDSPLPTTFTRSMSVDVSQLSASPEKISSAAKLRSVSHSPPRITRRTGHRSSMRASASPQIPPLIPELGCQPIFSNSTVSLASVCLNEEILHEESPESTLMEDKLNRSGNGKDPSAKI